MDFVDRRLVPLSGFSLAAGRATVGKMLAVDQLRRVHLDEFQHALGDGRGGVFAGHRQHVFAVNFRLDVGLAQNRVDILLDEVGLAFFDHEHRALANAEVFDFFVRPADK